MTHSKFIRVLTLLVGFVGITWSLEMIPYSLPGKLYPSKEYVTVSGQESGGLMAQMMHFAHSKYIKGCAVYSSTFYRCGPPNGNEDDFQAFCTKNSALSPDQQYQVDTTVAELEGYNIDHLIDPLENIRYSYLYVYCGLQNAEYTADQQLKVIALYEHYLESPYLIKARVQDTDIQMRVINTEYYNYGPLCPKLHEADGTVSKNCTDMSAPAEALGFLLGKYIYFENPFYPYMKYIYLQPLWSFDQTEFTKDLPDAGLDEVGYYYIPKRCQANAYSYGHSQGKSCLVHIYFHGCGQGREFLGTSHAKYSNYMEIAEANNIIVLFPQVLSSSTNPRGCWDYVGFSGELYATNKGQQIVAIWRMIARLLYLPVEPVPYKYATGRAKGGEKSYKGSQGKGNTYYGSPPPTSNYKTCNTPGGCGYQPFYRKY